MRVLVTGHDGYIGAVLVPLLEKAGHEVTGLDSFLYETCAYYDSGAPARVVRADVRDVTREAFEGQDAVIHLAAISNDPIGDLNPQSTYDVNHLATVRVARLAKEAGVSRFLFSSSCSLYGAGGDAALDETAPFNPVTAYGESKILSEQDLAGLADDAFSPVYLRNATAYGLSPKLRGDLVVNNLVGYAVATGEVLIKSDGTPWRPLVHVEDIARTFVHLLTAPRDLIHNQAFNVGRTSENYRIREIGEMVEAVVPGSRVTYAPGASPDKRNYRVNFDRLAATFSDLRLTWTVRDGVEQLYEAYTKHGMTLDDLTGPRLTRIQQVKALQAAGRLDEALRWHQQPVTV